MAPLLTGAEFSTLRIGSADFGGTAASSRWLWQYIQVDRLGWDT
jgi:hypothetical protein